MRIRTLIILLALGILGCSDETFDQNDFRDDPSTTTLNGTWKVISFENYSEETVEFKTEENSWGFDIIVTFNDTLDPNLLSGKNTTNSVVGEFDYVGTRQFKLHRLGSTFVGQPEWADKFGTAVLDGDVTFKINSERLRIYFHDKTESVTLSRE